MNNKDMKLRIESLERKQTWLMVIFISIVLPLLFIVSIALWFWIDNTNGRLDKLTIHSDATYERMDAMDSHVYELTEAVNTNTNMWNRVRARND